MESYFWTRNQQLPPDASTGSARFQTLFLYEHGAPQDFTLPANDYPSFELSAQTDIIAQTDVTAAPFAYQCVKTIQFLSVFARVIVPPVFGIDKHVLAFRVNGTDVVHGYLGIGNEIRLHGSVWMLLNDTLTLEIRAANRTGTDKILSLPNVMLGAAEIQYLPPSKIEQIAD